MKKTYMEDLKNEERQEIDKYPVTDNEAIKNSEAVNADKPNKDIDSAHDAPGYPHYPASEDLLNSANDMERVDIDVENITRAGNSLDDYSAAGTAVVLGDAGSPATNELEEEDDDIGIVPGTEADVTAEDLLLLGPKDQDMDLGEDEDLHDKVFPLDQTGHDLDVPGDELDDALEEIGEEDEENNYYSLGGDNHESQEEDQAAEES